jgi:predicted amidohydrolase YtcJ
MRLPGFIDAHLHVLGLGYVQSLVDLSDAKSIVAVVDLLKDSTHKKVIIGRGWNQDQFSEKRMLTKNDLKEVSEDIPMVLIRTCGHVMVVNDAMLKMAEITENSPQIEGGSFSYETGIFSEKALNIIYDRIPKPTKEDLIKYFLTADKILIRQGITSVASDDFSIFQIDYEMVINVLKELYDQGLMKVRLTEQVNLPLEKLKDFIRKGYVNKKFHPKFKMGPLKILADGSLGGRTAAMIEPYSDAPDTYGIKTYSDKDLYEMVDLANREGMDSVIHAIGDATSLQVIQTLNKSIENTKRFKHAHAIIHAQLTPKYQIEMMEKYQIGAIVQPIFINTDIKIVGDRIGPRLTDCYLFHTMYQKIPLGFSTDAPIEPVNPLMNIYTAMTYKSIKYPHENPLNINEVFTLNEALKAYYENNLPYVYEEDLSSDYVEIDQDIFSVEVEDIKNIKILKTVIDDQVVFSSKTNK